MDKGMCSEEAEKPNLLLRKKRKGKKGRRKGGEREGRRVEERQRLLHSNWLP